MKRAGNTLAFSYCLVSPALAVAMTAREFGVDFWALWDELGADIPRVERFPPPQPCPPVEPVPTQELFRCCLRRHGVLLAVGRRNAVLRRDGGVDAVARAELDGITDTIPPDKFLQTMVEAIASAGSYAFRDMFYGFIARQAEPRRQAAVLLLERLAERGEPNIRRYLGDSRESRAAGESVRFLKRHTL